MLPKPQNARGHSVRMRARMKLSGYPRLNLPRQPNTHLIHKAPSISPNYPCARHRGPQTFLALRFPDTNTNDACLDYANAFRSFLSSSCDYYQLLFYGGGRRVLSYSGSDIASGMTDEMDPTDPSVRRFSFTSTKREPCDVDDPPLIDLDADSSDDCVPAAQTMREDRVGNVNFDRQDFHQGYHFETVFRLLVFWFGS